MLEYVARAMRGGGAGAGRRKSGAGQEEEEEAKGKQDQEDFSDRGEFQCYSGVLR